VRAGKTITATATELGISTGALHNWVRQDQIDRDERPGLTTYESAELAKAKKRIRALEVEVEILKWAAKLFEEDAPAQEDSSGDR
jgi:transposase-like protein